MLKADFHIHTHYSKCSDMRPRELVKTAISRGYDVIGVVDHNRTDGGLAVKKIAGKKLLVIPGEEIMTKQGEVVVLLSDGKYNRDLLDICERAGDENHFIFAPHPFDFLRFRNSLKHNIEMAKNYLDAIEVLNSRVMIRRFNDMAKEYSTKNRISRIAGSDAHFVEELGNVECLLECDRNVDSVLNFLRSNRLSFQGKKSSLNVHFKSNIALPLSRLLRF